MPARPINGRRQFGKFAVSNGHVGFIGAIRCTGVNDKHMIINGNKELNSKRARSCLARDPLRALGVRSDRGLLARRIPHSGSTVPTQFHIEPNFLMFLPPHCWGRRIRVILMWPMLNPSLNRTRYGMQCKSGKFQFHYGHTPGLHCENTFIAQ